MGCSTGGLLKTLGLIDRGVKKGRYSEKQHDSMSAKAIDKCLGHNGGTPHNLSLHIQKFNWPIVNKTKLFDRR